MSQHRRFTVANVWIVSLIMISTVLTCVAATTVGIQEGNTTMSAWIETLENNPLRFAVALVVGTGVVVASIMMWMHSSITARKDAVIQQKDAMIEMLRAQSASPLVPSTRTESGQIVTLWKHEGPLRKHIAGLRNTLLFPGTLPTLTVEHSNEVFEARFKMSCCFINDNAFTVPPLFALGFAIDIAPPEESSLDHEGLQVFQTGRLDGGAYAGETLGGSAILTGLKPGTHSIGVWFVPHYLAPSAEVNLRDLQLCIVRLGTLDIGKSNQRSNQ